MKRKSIPMILASGSIWRKRLLQKHGIVVRRFVTDFKERKTGPSPEEIVKYNALGKAQSASARFPDRWIIGVDTIGFLNGELLLKPKNRADARKMLATMSGSKHMVLSGLCLINKSKGFCKTIVEATGVIFKKLTSQEIERYLDSGQWRGKAGSYAIQGAAKGFVEKIEGDITNVIGLPIERLKKLLKKISS